MYNSIVLFMSDPFFPLPKVCSDQHSLHLSSTASFEFLEILAFIELFPGVYICHVLEEWHFMGGNVYCFSKLNNYFLEERKR